MKNLKALREAAGLTQQQLGDLCGISRFAIMEYEACRRSPTFSTVKKISTILRCSLDELDENPTLPRDSRPGDRKRKAGGEPVKRDRRKRSAA